MAEKNPQQSTLSDADVSRKLGLDAGSSRRWRFLKWGVLTVALVLSNAMHFPFVFRPGIVAVAFLSSAAVGEIFG